MLHFEAKNYEYLLGIEGFSDALLSNHLTLYQGYVVNTNKLQERLKIFLKEDKTDSPEYAELKRRFGWEFNGIRLHEHYFGNMTKEKKELEKESKLYKKIEEEFGSFENWGKDFKATGAMRGIGWVILYFDPESGHLFNTWINEHDVGHLSSSVQILVMDVFEHAFMLGYGLKRIDYIEAFFKVIDWGEVEKRFK